MKLAIIDPGYSHPETHHHSVNLEIASAISKKDIQTVVFSAKRIEQRCINTAQSRGIELIPYFKTPCYFMSLGEVTPDGYRDLAHDFFLELSQLFESRLMEGVVSLYFHTGFGFHLLGLARALRKIKLKNLNNVIITLMFNPGARIEGEFVNVWDSSEYSTYLMAFRCLEECSKETGLKIEVATSCRAYQQIYQKLSSFNSVEIHPAINQVRSSDNLAKIEGNKERVLLYLGGPKVSKGIEFSAQLAPLAAKKFPQAEFVFHYNSDFPGAKPQFQSVIEPLKGSTKTLNNLLIKEGFLESDAYQCLLHSCGVVAILYNPSEYSFKTSGVFWDALKSKTQQWIVSRGTWIADELSELGIPYSAVDYGDIESALIGIEKLLADNKKGVKYNLENKPEGLDYLKILTSPFSDWLLSKISVPDDLANNLPQAA